MADHFHAYIAPAEGSVRAFTCRSSDVFASRAAAAKWASAQREAARRFVRQCDGGPPCPGSDLPDERSPLPAPRPRRRRSARLLRLRRRLDDLDALGLAAVEAFLNSGGVMSEALPAPSGHRVTTAPLASRD